MSKPRATTLGIPAAVLAATAITILSVWLLSMLNVRALPNTPAPQSIRAVMIRTQASKPVRRPRRNESLESASEPSPASPPQIMTAQLEMPVPDPVTLPPLHLDLELPPAAYDRVAVTIHRPPVKPPKWMPSQSPLTKIVAEEIPIRRMETAVPPVPPVAIEPPRPNHVRPNRATPRPTPTTNSIARSQVTQPSSPVATITPVGPVVHRSDRVDQPPREGYGNTQPAYPLRERNLGIEGSVLVKLLIDENGRVKDAKVLRGPEAFRKPVLAVVFDWQFTPAEHQGRPVKVWGVKEVQFRLRTQ